MSLDILLTETLPTEVCDMNYTHNVTNMWRKAGVYDALYMSEGKKASEVIKQLEDGIKHMTENPEEYIKMNPENGWGSYETALPWLKEFCCSCKEHPEAIIGVSK